MRRKNIVALVLGAVTLGLLAGCTSREEEELVMPRRPDAARIALREEALLAAGKLAGAPAPAVVTVVIERTVYVPITTAAPAAVTTTVKPAPTLGSNVLAIVGDDVVTVDDFRRAFPGPSLDKLPEYLRREVRTFVDQMINNRVLAYAAMHEDFSNRPDFQRDLDAAIAQVKTRYMYEEKIAAPSKVSEEEIAAYYRAHAAEFVVPERVRARHILVEVRPDAPPAEQSNAWHKAQALRRRVMEGEDFAEVAARESSCPSRARGGDLDYFTRGQMAPAFEAAAFGLERNEISPVVQTEFGYHIIQLLDRLPERRRSLAEAREEIRGLLEQQRERARYEQLLATLTNTYRVIRNERVIQDLVHSRL